MVFQKFISQGFCCVLGASIPYFFGAMETQAVIFTPLPPSTCYQELNLCFDDVTFEYQIQTDAPSATKYPSLTAMSFYPSSENSTMESYVLLFPKIDTQNFDVLERVEEELKYLIYKKATITEPFDFNWSIMEPLNPSIEEESLPVKNVQHPEAYDIDNIIFDRSIIHDSSL